MNEVFLDTKWDVIVLGTGVGGSIAGLRLAQAKKKVLFVEQGRNFFSSESRVNIRNHSHIEKSKLNTKANLSEFGLWSDEIEDISNSKQKFIPFLGQGVGGSSLYYGAAMERFFPKDFESEKYFFNQKDSSVVNWPLSYEDFAKYYLEAEQIFKVNGGNDPLRKGFQNINFKESHFTEAGKKLKHIWEMRGLSPYRLPIAHKPFVESSCLGCQAEICLEHDKVDAGDCGVRVAIKQYGAALLENTKALEIVMKNETAVGVWVVNFGKKILLKGKLIIIACGALNTPVLMLSSITEKNPNGIGNHSRMVGKNLSRHFMDLYSVFISPKVGDICYWDKELALNNFYFYEDQKFGTVQSLGSPPHFNLIKYELFQQYGTSLKISERVYFQLVSKFGKFFVNKLFNNTISIAAIMDDANYYGNRVDVGTKESPIKIYYKMSDIDKIRLENFRELIKKSFGNTKVILHKQGENNQRLAHASGTARMGLDPNHSVVDPSCKVHFTDNIYIVDSSVFPTGSGINPALTIAANALRVSDIILGNQNIS